MTMYYVVSEKTVKRLTRLMFSKEIVHYSWKFINENVSSMLLCETFMIHILKHLLMNGDIKSTYFLIKVPSFKADKDH